MSSLYLLLGAYILGAVPFSLFIASLKGIDIRQHGSRNIGATNVFRTVGPIYGIIAFTLDILKGYLPTVLAIQISSDPWLHVAVGMMSILGHSASIFLKFKGGKGAATGLGMLLALSWKPALIVFVIVALLIAIGRVVSIATIFGCILMPILLFIFEAQTEYVMVVSVICLFIIWRHRSNIKRLVEGKENKI